MKYTFTFASFPHSDGFVFRCSEYIGAFSHDCHTPHDAFMFCYSTIHHYTCLNHHITVLAVKYNIQHQNIQNRIKIFITKNNITITNFIRIRAAGLIALT